jgi:hypothetical protein
MCFLSALAVAAGYGSGTTLISLLHCCPLPLLLHCCPLPLLLLLLLLLLTFQCVASHQ